ncbi:MAG: hypothetical protein E6929_13480 [Clostridium sp.]|nr:hypothetical protein [Clostridium sp.]
MEGGLIFAGIVIGVAEILRFFRENKRLRREIDEIKDRVQFLEDNINGK